MKTLGHRVLCVSLMLVATFSATGALAQSPTSPPTNKGDNANVVRAEVRLTRSALDGRGNLYDGVLGRVDIDAQSDLGVGRRYRPGARLELTRHGRHSLQLDYLDLVFAGQGLIDRRLQLLGFVNLRIRRQVDSRFQFRQAALSYTYRFRLGRMSIGPKFDLRRVGISSDLKATGSDGTSRDLRSISRLAPTAGFQADLRVARRLRFNVSASGIGWRRGGFLYDIEAGAEYDVGSHYALTGGVRRIAAFDRPGDRFIRGGIDQHFIGLKYTFGNPKGVKP